MYYKNPINRDLYKKLNKDRKLNYYFRSDKVGKCVKIFDEFYSDGNYNFSRDDWDRYYFERNSTEPLLNAAEYITENYDVDLQTSKRYVMYRVLGQTWNGMQEEHNVIRDLENEFPNILFQKTSYELDEQYFVDWEAYSNGDLLFGIQIKPFTYEKMNTPYQQQAKANHAAQKEKYREEFKAPHIMIYYKDHEIYNREYLINQINTILAYNINVK